MAVTENDLVAGPLVPASGVSLISLDFFFERAEWLEVYKSGSEQPLVLGAGYTVSGEGTTSGSVNLTVPANGEDAYSVYLVVPLRRSSDMQLRGEFKSGPFNVEMDRIWQRLQYHWTQIGRTLRLSSTSLASGLLPDLLPGQFLRLRDDGSGFEGSFPDFVVSVVPTWYQTRELTSLTGAAALGVGAVVTIAGLQYIRVAGGDAGDDQGVSGLLPYGMYQPEHYGNAGVGVDDARLKRLGASAAENGGAVEGNGNYTVTDLFSLGVLAELERRGAGTITVLSTGEVLPFATPHFNKFNEANRTRGVDNAGRRFAYEDDYYAFPTGTPVPDSNVDVVMAYHSTQHTGSDLQGSMRVFRTMDSGTTFTDPLLLTGNYDPDAAGGPKTGDVRAYTPCCGLDGRNRVVFMARMIDTVLATWEIHLWRSADGHFIGPTHVIPIPGYDGTGGSYTPWKHLKPSKEAAGGVSLCGYLGDDNHILTITDDNVVTLSAALVSTDPDISEAVHLETAPGEFVMIMRRSGVSAPLLATWNRGDAAWSVPVSIGLPETGGLLVQQMDYVTLRGSAYVYLMMGARDTQSATPEDAPGASLYITRLADLVQDRVSDPFYWRKVQKKTFVEDEGQRGGYLRVYLRENGDLMVVLDNEISQDPPIQKSELVVFHMVNPFEKLFEDLSDFRLTLDNGADGNVLISTNTTPFNVLTFNKTPVSTTGFENGGIRGNVKRNGQVFTVTEGGLWLFTLNLHMGGFDELEAKWLDGAFVPASQSIVDIKLNFNNGVTDPFWYAYPRRAAPIAWQYSIPVHLEAGTTVKVEVKITSPETAKNVTVYKDRTWFAGRLLE